MNSDVKALKSIELNINYDDFIKTSQIKRTSKIASYVDQVLPIVENLAEPSTWYRIDRLKGINNGIIELNDKTRFKVKNISVAFQNAEYVISFICTIGGKIDGKLQQLYQTSNLLKIWLFDTLSSYFVEQLVESFRKTISSQFNNLHPTYSFSPGYCNWEIIEQKKLFHLFKDSDVRVSLKQDSYMMLPQKSISGIFGLSEKESSETNPCRYCSKKDCLTRRTKRSF
ncbi:MAG: hypothetical protein U9R43_04970 [Thermodesulfobacteriota bacterium]|nr:hypothetical protein [Thermodesulfobacteriota bacterium]